MMQPQQPQYYQAQQPVAQPYPQQYGPPTPAQPMMTPKMMLFLSMLLIAFGVIIVGIGLLVNFSYDSLKIVGVGILLAGVGLLLKALGTYMKK